MCKRKQIFYNNSYVWQWGKKNFCPFKLPIFKLVNIDEVEIKLIVLGLEKTYCLMALASLVGQILRGGAKSLPLKF